MNQTDASIYEIRRKRESEIKAQMLLAECGVKVLREAAPEVEPIAEGKA